MSSTEPPGASTTTSPPPTSRCDMPPANPTRRVAPHRRYAKKFLTLPDELLTKISDAVAPKDLPNFRLTCKTLANISAKHLGEKRLAHCRFVFSRYSMKGLVDMTAHPVFGRCVKSVLFGTDHLTDRLGYLMDALESHNITDPTEAMHVLQKYRERHARWSKFRDSYELHDMLLTALSNLSSLGTSVSLGIYNDFSKVPHKEVVLRGYGSSHELGDLPFTVFTAFDKATLDTMRTVCGMANYHPELLEFDLRGQESYEGMGEALSELLLTNTGQPELQTAFDVCIRKGYVDIRILSSQNRLEFKQRPVDNQMLCVSDPAWFTLHSLGRSMRDALFSAPFTHFHIQSCSMQGWHLRDVLEALAGTLQVVEMIDVVVGDGDPEFDAEPLLHCIRDDLRLHTLVLDNVRVTSRNPSDTPGKCLAKGRLWHGQQRIRAGIDVLTGFDGCGWDNNYYDDRYKDGIDRDESKLEKMKYPHDIENGTKYERFLKFKAKKEERLEELRKEYAEYKVNRARAEEAMARVEAGDFDS